MERISSTNSTEAMRWPAGLLQYLLSCFSAPCNCLAWEFWGNTLRGSTTYAEGCPHSFLMVANRSGIFRLAGQDRLLPQIAVRERSHALQGTAYEDCVDGAPSERVSSRAADLAARLSGATWSTTLQTARAREL